MLVPHLETLNLPARRMARVRSGLRREWCFWRAVLNRFLGRALLVLAVILAGAAAFLTLEPRCKDDPARAFYDTWLLIFANPTEEFPAHPLLRVFFFLLPVLGVVLIIQVIVDVSLMVRDRRSAERNWCRAMAASMKDHIILVGLGRLGYRTYRLLQKLGEDVVVIERTTEGEFLETIRLEGAALLVGDARREATLLEANVAQARALITATNDDLANLEVALDARRLNPRIRIVLRMFDQNMADKVRDAFNIRVAMSQAALSAPTFAMAAVDPSIVGTQVIGETLIVQQCWQAKPGGPLVGKALGELPAAYGFSIMQRKAADGTVQLFPPAALRIEAGDELLVQGAYEALVGLRKRGVEF